MLDDDLFQVSVDNDGVICLFVIQVTNEEVLLKRRVDYLGSSDVDDPWSFKCFKIFMLDDKETEGEPADVKVFFTQDFLVVSTMCTIQWKHVNMLSSKSEFMNIDFDSFNPTILN